MIQKNTKFLKMYVSFECVETTAPQDIEKSNIASGVPVMVILCHSEVMGAIQFKFFRGKTRNRLYNFVAKKSARNGPARKSSMGNLVGRMRLRSDMAQMKFKALLLSPILWDILRHSCARYLDPATKARRSRYRYFTLSRWKYESSPTSRFQNGFELCNR